LLYIVIICVYFWVFIFLYFLQSLPWDFYAKIQKGDILLQQFFSVIKREVYITHHCVLYTGNYGNWFFFLHVHQCILYSLITAILYIREILLQIFSRGQIGHGLQVYVESNCLHPSPSLIDLKTVKKSLSYSPKYIVQYLIYYAHIQHDKNMLCKS
jgi:hypothetical protein